jgi:signal transduction histidine kinase/DNA-binding response OmpR family regulator
MADGDRPTYKVLVIDDDADDYVLVRDLLAEIPTSQFRVDWAPTYDAAVETVCRDEHDVYLLDLRLGERDGLELLRELIAQGCEAPIILLTGQGGYEVDVEAMRSGAADYLVKSQLTAELLDRSIRFAVERKRTESELRRYRHFLEEMVQEHTAQLNERTQQLEAANGELRLEVTERRKAEEFLTNVLESLAHPFYVIDANDYTIKMANSAAAPDGLPPNVACYTLTHRRTKPCEGSEHYCPLEMIKRTKTPALTEHIHYDSDGNARHVEVHSYPILDKQGNVAQIIEYTLDITKRKEVEEELRRARHELELRVEERTAQLERAYEALRLDETRLEALWELSQMSEASVEQLADFAMKQQVRLTNSRIGWLGFMNEDESVLTMHTLSESLMDRCFISDRPIHFPIESAGIWADAVRERRAIIVNDYPAPHPHKRGYPAGHAPLSHLMVIPVFDGSRIVAVAAVANKEEKYNESDVRQSTLLMDGMWKLIRRQRAEKALRESESLVAMGRALSSLAHDMKTPLIAIGGFASLVRRRMERDNPLRSKLEIVIKETERLEKMVRNMLDFSRPVELERNAEDIDKLIMECLEIAKPVARERKVHLESRCDRSLPSALLDAARMKQAIINLVVNAIQASPEAETVTVLGRQNRKRLLIDVIDHGPGVPPEKREEIFAPFLTTKKEGTGLGLPIVKKFVEAHDGRILVLSNPDKGATFRIELPCIVCTENGLVNESGAISTVPA